MLIYNITTKIEARVADYWVQWMVTEHIPEVMQTNCFMEYRFARILEQDDSDGPTYTIQYLIESKADYNRYLELYAHALRQKIIEKWQQQVISFHTLMEVVES
jgi:hypothetical protein